MANVDFTHAELLDLEEARSFLANTGMTSIDVSNCSILSRNKISVQGRFVNVNCSHGRGFLFENNNGTIGKKIGEVTSDYTGLVVFSSPAYDFFSHNYFIGFGPFYSATNIESIGATCTFVDKIFEDQQSSKISKFQNPQGNKVSAKFQVPDYTIDAKTTVTAYVVNGPNPLQANGNAIGGKVVQIPSVNRGQIDIVFDSNPIASGNTYTVCLGVYSWERILAYYTFTMD